VKKLGKPRNDTTNMHRILEALSQKNQSSQELAENLKFPLGTSRAMLSMLNRMGLVKPTPELKRGTPYTLTQKGRQQLEDLKKET
jgi:DNA-binding IclR family transcriptional regulator